MDEEGQKVWSADTSIYGALRNVQGEAQACPFRYPGQYEDVETGLYYNRFRYYDRNASEYISMDPLGLIGGHRLYGYVSDPLFWQDPFGLTGCKSKSKGTPKPEIFEIEDGVRRTKASQLAGKKTIKADVMVDGRIVAKDVEIPIDNLRSPHKTEIDVSSSSANMQRWDRAYQGAVSGDDMPNILVKPGNRGVKVEDIVFS